MVGSGFVCILRRVSHTRYAARMKSTIPCGELYHVTIPFIFCNIVN